MTTVFFLPNVSRSIILSSVFLCLNQHTAMAESPETPWILISELLANLKEEERTAALDRLLDDLNQPIVGELGPFSFARLAGWSQEECAELREQSFLGLLMKPTTNPHWLRELRRVAEVIAVSSFPHQIRLAAKTIMELATANLCRHHGEQEGRSASTWLVKSLSTDSDIQRS